MKMDTVFQVQVEGSAILWMRRVAQIELGLEVGLDWWVSIANWTVSEFGPRWALTMESNIESVNNRYPKIIW